MGITKIHLNLKYGIPTPSTQNPARTQLHLFSLILNRLGLILEHLKLQTSQMGLSKPHCCGSAEYLKLTLVCNQTRTLLSTASNALVCNQRRYPHTLAQAWASKRAPTEHLQSINTLSQHCQFTQRSYFDIVEATPPSPLSCFFFFWLHSLLHSTTKAHFVLFNETFVMVHALNTWNFFPQAFSYCSSASLLAYHLHDN